MKNLTLRQQRDLLWGKAQRVLNKSNSADDTWVDVPKSCLDELGAALLATSGSDQESEASEHTMQQYAPYPTILADLVANLKYRPGWTFKLEDIERDPADTHGAAAGGLTFIGLTGTTTRTEGGREYVGAEDAYHPGVPRPVYFYFPVPAATYDERSWRRWLFDRLLDVETHEAMEHFQIGDERPYSPSHGPGNDPYMIREIGTDIDQQTSFRGVIKSV